MINNNISEEDARAAVRTLLAYIGEDPKRNGLIDTPKRVINSYKQFFSGYSVDPNSILSKTFDNTGEYQGIVIVKDISVISHCEHHMVPILGKAHVAYIPDRKIVGLSKLARVVEVFARRLQTQEHLTVQIANAINDCLAPSGVAVIIDAQHQCMSTRGVQKAKATTVTSHYIGEFKNDFQTREELYRLIES